MFLTTHFTIHSMPSFTPSLYQKQTVVSLQILIPSDQVHIMKTAFLTTQPLVVPWSIMSSANISLSLLAHIFITQLQSFKLISHKYLFVLFKEMSATHVHMFVCIYTEWNIITVVFLKVICTANMKY